MVSVVVRQQQHLAQDGLAVSPRYFLKEIGARARDQILHRLEILLEARDTFIPGDRIRWRGSFRPIFLWPFRGDVFRIAAELENVPLRDAEMFKQHPGGMGEAIWLRGPQLFRDIRDRIFKFRVRFSAFKQADELVAQSFVVNGISWQFAVLFLRDKRVKFPAPGGAWEASVSRRGRKFLRRGYFDSTNVSKLRDAP